MKRSMSELVPVEKIESKIYLIRGQKVMLDKDLAELYGVATKALVQAVKRNMERFPEDFMLQLTFPEYAILRSQIVTSKWGGRRYRPYVFTEQGVAMLSSVLKSRRAARVNVQIMRTFSRLRQILASHEDLRKKIEIMERKYDQQFKVVFEAIKAMIETPEKKNIGFLRQ